MKTYASVKGIRFNKSHVVNADAYIPPGHYNPHRVRPWLIHNEYGVLGVVFAPDLTEALDLLADDGRMDCQREDDTECELVHLGNDGATYDLTYVGYDEVSLPFDVAVD